MSIHYNDIIKQGYVKLKGQKVGTWKKHWVILKKSSSKGGRRLEKYQDEKSSILGHESKVIALESVKQIYRMPSEAKKQAVAVVFFDGSQRQFSCDSDLEANSWVDILKEECLIANNNTIKVHNPDILSDVPSEIRDDVYHVYLLPSPMLDIYGECVMAITGEHILLLDVENTSKQLMSWPLSALRRYGRDADKLTFEAGRHCETGEGLFVFNTTQGDRIYKSIHSATESIAATYRVTRRQQEQIGAQASAAPAKPGLTHSKSVSPTSSEPECGSPFGKLHTSKSFPSSGSKPPIPPPGRPPRTAPLPPLPGVHPAGDYDYLAKSYSGQAPEPPPPRKNSQGVSPSGSRNPSTSSETSVVSSPFLETSAETLAEKIAKARLDLLPLGAPPPPPPMRRPSEKSDTESECIYEEKGLEPVFRKFLAGRKEDEPGFRKFEASRKEDDAL